LFNYFGNLGFFSKKWVGWDHLHETFVTLKPFPGERRTVDVWNRLKERWLERFNLGRMANRSTFSEISIVIGVI
jgi:hypothetical protein